MPPTVARPWAVATAALLHLAPFVWLWSMTDPLRPGAIATGSGGIEVALAPAGGAAAATAPSEAPKAETTRASLPAAAVPAQPASVEPLPSAEQTSTTTAPAAKSMAAPALPKPRPPVAQARRQPGPDTAARTVAQPGPKPQATTAPGAAPGPADADRAAPEAAEGRSGGGPAPAPGQAGAAPGGGDPGTMQNYLTRLATWLERHKEYPPASRLRREEGAVLLRFAIGRDGRLLSWKIERSSGHEPLDREVATMVRRAAPFPAMPADLPQDRLELTVPVQFRLR